MRKKTIILFLLFATLFKIVNIDFTPENTSNKAFCANPVVTMQKKTFILDKAGNSHIAWVRNIENDLCLMYIKWSSLGWVNCYGSQYPENSAQICVRVSSSFALMNPSIDVDSENKPAISFIIGDGNLFFLVYIKWNGSYWVNAKNKLFEFTTSKINDGLKCPHHPALKLDSKRNPHIVWSEYDNGMPNISYIRWNGKEWVNSWDKPYPQNSSYICRSEKACKLPSIAIDSNDFAHIAWTESEPLGFSKIQYARWNGSKWVNFRDTLFTSKGYEVSNLENSSYSPSLVLDKKDTPHIAFVSHSKGNIGICYIKLNGKKWLNTAGKPYPANSGFIAEREYTYYRHYYQNPCLDLRENGLPNVVWEGAGNDETNTIFYLCLEEYKWKNCIGEEYPCNADISKDCINSNLPIIRLCPKGRPNIIWMGYKPGNLSSLCFIRWDGSTWVNAFGQPYPKHSSSIDE